jgi:hypothetical protein
LPIIAVLIVVFTFATALRTHFHKYLELSSSLNSKASWIHVDAHDGTIDLPICHDDNVISTSTVGFPLESNTSRAKTF